MRPNEGYYARITMAGSPTGLPSPPISIASMSASSSGASSMSPGAARTARPRVASVAVAEPPEIRYVDCDGRDLAYQVVGTGSSGVVCILELSTHLDLLWTDPAWSNQFERFGSLWRAALFQLRGVGLSEPVDRRPTLEEQASDILAVMDAAGIERAVVFTAFSTSAGAIVFAASHPERVEALLMLDPLVSGPLSADPDLTGWEPGEARAYMDRWFEVADRWGSGGVVDVWDPALASPRAYRQVGLLERTSASRPVARAYIQAAMRADVSSVAVHVHAPAHVLHMPTNPLPEAVARHTADLFPSGELHIVRSTQPGMSWGESFVVFFEYVVELLSGRPASPSDRLLATVMFEDVVGSTMLVAEIGDDAWRELRLKRDRLVTNCVEEHAGWIISTAGDGSMCTFPGPAFALRCAEQLHEAVRPLGILLRIGIHTGECERIGNDLAGLAVHIAARIGANAAPGQTLVSRTVADLVTGSELRLDSEGIHKLSGVPGSWELLAAATSAAGPARPAEPPAPRLTDRAVVLAARRVPQLVSAVSRLEQARARRRA
jgi:class 3 adenylate cyclase/pimeloyl-ACP methyl ester carboxylesterase